MFALGVEGFVVKHSILLRREDVNVSGYMNVEQMVTPNR